MAVINLENIELIYFTKIDKRRTSYQIKIMAEDTLIITLPSSTNSSNIKKIITNHKAWILKQLNQYRCLNSQNLEHDFELLYLGQAYVLILIPENIPSIEIELQSTDVIIRYPKDLKNASVFIKAALKDFLIQEAAKLLKSKTNHWKALIGVNPHRICIKEQKTRWGSCSSLGNINYNWRIVMSPEKIVDYLVIHELCHMLIPNHSKLFWSTVQTFCPEYKESRNWLKKNGLRLMSFFNKHSL